MSAILYENEPCPRCGSKKSVSKPRKQILPTLSGSTEVEYSQIMCTNALCQHEFEINLAREQKKREVLRVEKERNDKKRKADSLKLKKKLLLKLKKKKSN